VVAVVAVMTAARLALAEHATWQELIDENEATNAVLGVTFALLGALAVADRPRNPLSWLFVAEGQAQALVVLGGRWFSYAESEPQAVLVEAAVWVSAYLWIPAFLLLVVIMPLIYPTGSPQSAPWRLVTRVAVIFTTAASLMAITSNVPIEDSYPGQSNPLGRFPWSDSLTGLVVAGLMTLVFGAIGLISLVMRFRRGGPVVRAQVGLLFLALLFNLVAIPLPQEVLGLVGAAFFAMALGLAVVRYGLYDVERLFNRTAVYAALTIGVLAVIAIFVGLLGSRMDDNAVAAVLAALVVALGVGPAREWLQRGVDRLMYGKRSNPYAALADIARQFEQAPSEAGILPAVAAAITDTLRLPYAAIMLHGEDSPAAAAGTAPEKTVDLPLIHAGEDVGLLRVGLRRGERQLSRRDLDLLTDFTRLVAAAAHEVALTADLRRSRERLVLAREEERRRLRRELHDGVGPGLAGLALGVGAARRAAGRSDPRALTMLSGLETDAEALLGDVRRISHDLRPAALDELGLVGALRQRADAITDASSGKPEVRVEVDGVPALPAAVEVAAYRIATEAVSNAVRHAEARHCTVRLTVDASLKLEVSDDGRGLPTSVPSGLGLRSMAERAAELGGACDVYSEPGSGTVVRAELPLTVGR
jgi:signal transduction histidine kinase